MDFGEEKQKSPESKPHMKAHGRAFLIRGNKKNFFLIFVFKSNWFQLQIPHVIPLLTFS